MQRRSSRRSVSRRNSLSRGSPTEASWQEKRTYNLTTHCLRYLFKVDDNPKPKGTLSEGVFNDVKNDHSKSEELIIQEFNSKFAVQYEETGETSSTSWQRSRVYWIKLDNIGQKAEFQSCRQEQQRRISFANVASVPCETDFKSLDISNNENSNHVCANKPQQLEQRQTQQRRSLPFFSLLARQMTILLFMVLLKYIDFLVFFTLLFIPEWLVDSLFLP